MPVFTLPLLGLAAAVAVPALAGIYWLRNRFKRHPVSSLMLWADHRAPREGGARMQRLQTPLLFFLEVAAIVLLVLAATGPRILTDHAASPLMIVLDDSYSMQAQVADGRSVRDRAREAVMSAIGSETSGGGGQVRVILAGPEPQRVGSVIRNRPQAAAALEQWTAQSPRAALSEAVTFAAELGGPKARVLVICDHEPPRDLGEGATQWWSFGEPAANAAIVNAVRSAGDLGHRCLIELATLGDTARTIRLTVTAEGVDQPLRNQAITLAPNDPHRVVFTVPAETPTLHVRLGDDALAMDNHATLLPPDEKTIRVQTAIANESLRRAVARAIDSTGRAKLVSATGDVLVTDSDKPVLVGPRTWPVYLRSVPRDQAEAYVGPFVLNHGHPLTEGLGLAGVIWSAGNDPNTPGAPVVMAGNVPLVTDVARAGGRHDIHIQLNAGASTLTRSINWPVLWWNLVRWRADEAPGVRNVNIRLGTTTQLIVDDAASIELVNPAGETTTMPVVNRRVTLRGDRAGVWSIHAGDTTHRLAVNALNHDESNLTGATSDRWGRWVDDASIRQAYADMSWLAMLAAAGVLGTHLWLVHKAGRGGQAQ